MARDHVTSGQEAAQTLARSLPLAHAQTTVGKLVIFCTAAFQHPPQLLAAVVQDECISGGAA